MSRFLTCPRGHRWELPADSPPTGAASGACPFCGAPPDGAPATNAPEAATLPPSPPSPLAAPDGEATLPPDSLGGWTGADDRRTLRPAPGPDDPESVRPVVAGYEILGELGRGGMGVVYKARHTRLNRLVALKMILAGAHAREEDLARFSAEAEAVAGLRHPNIVQIYDVGEQGGLPYFSLEFVEGGTLEGRLDGTPWEAPRAAQLVETLARAIHAAHERGVIHRDLKPANVLLTADGTPKITDFGLAKRLDQDSGQTRTGTIMGTPSYMAPEQAGGRRDALGPRTDVYALGAVLYELLTGRPPFKAATPLDTVLQVIHREPVPPAQLNAKVPRDLETVCLKCLHKEPERRYASAQELAEDLHRFRNHEPIRARPVGRTERLGRWCRRNPVVAALTAAVAVALVAGTVISSWFAVQSNRYAVQADLRAQEAARRLYIADMRLIPHAWSQGQFDRVRQLLDDHKAEHTGEAGQPGFDEWYYWDHLLHGGLHPVPSRPVQCLAYSPDGKTLASAGLGNTVRLWDVDSGRVVRSLQGHNETVYSLAYSPKGEYLASAGTDMTVEVWNPTDGELLRTLRHSGSVRGVAFSTDGRQLASASDDKTVRVWDATNGGVVAELRRDAAVLCVAFSPDRRHLALGGKENAITVWDVDIQQPEQPFRDAHSDGVAGLAYSPNGEYLASASLDQKVKVWDTTTGRLVCAPLEHDNSVLGVAFSPDGRHLASASLDRTARLWDAVTGQSVCRPCPHDAAVRAVAFSGDGLQMASGGGDRVVKIWEAATGRLVKTLNSSIQALAFSLDDKPVDPGGKELLVRVLHPSGGQVAYTFRGHTSNGGLVTCVAFGKDNLLASTGWHCLVNVWDLTGRRQPPRPVPEGLDYVRSLAFSPDGKRLALGGRKGSVLVEDVADGTVRQTLQGHKGAVRSVAYSSDGQYLASAGEDGTVCVWDAATGGKRFDPLQTQQGLVAAVAFSPNGQRLASAGEDHTIRLWDAVRGGDPLRTLRGHDGTVNGVAFSPDGKLLASASSDRTVRVWDVASGQPVRKLEGHDLGVNAVAFCPHGRCLASASEDGTVKLWETDSGEEVLTLRGHSDGVTSLAFSRDGWLLASASKDGTVKVWDATH
jgi:WD40 repeat protein/tRNA A-37 threonylcarbamoyl transferase component Bud32